MLATHSALHILTAAGYIEFVEEIEAQSRVMILANKDELYDLKTSTPGADRVLQAILRLYTGLFADYALINEEVICRRTGLDHETVYNSLLESKAIIWNPSGRYSIDYDKTWKALETVGAEILRMQAHGDVDSARAWISKYGVAGPESLSDKRVLENAGIPVDIRFKYE